MNLFSIILDGCSRLPLCVLCSLSLSLSLLPLLSRLCVAVHCSEIIFCNVFDASLPKICHCLLLFVAVFFSPTPLSFLFVRKFSFVSVLEQPSLEAFFCQFFKAEWRKNHKSLCCCKGRTATTTRRTRRTMYIVLSLSPMCEELLLFRSKPATDDESGGKQVR
jgi:hypothetical protein